MGTAFMALINNYYIILIFFQEKTKELVHFVRPSFLFGIALKIQLHRCAKFNNFNSSVNYSM